MAVIILAVSGTELTKRLHDPAEPYVSHVNGSGPGVVGPFDFSDDIDEAEIFRNHAAAMKCLITRIKYCYGFDEGPTMSDEDFLACFKIVPLSEYEKIELPPLQPAC